jgi:membrane fusion protein (multidrug efflux system)
MMDALKRVALAIVAISVIAGTGIGTWLWWTANRSIQTTDNAYVRGDTTILSPRVSGYAVEVLADDNRPVAAKQILVRIDPRDFRLARDRAQATVADAEARLSQAKARLVLQRSLIKVREAGLRSAEAQSRNAETTLGRARQLLAQNAGTQARVDDTETAVLSAHAAVDQAVANLSYDSDQVVVLAADEQTAAASLSSARAALHAAEIALEDTEVWAPIPGVVANRRVRVGEYVTVGSRMLSIVPTDGLWIEANFRETQIAAMRPEDPVAITIDAHPGVEFCGYVESIAPASGSEFALIPPDNATGNFTKIVRRVPVRIRLNATQSRADALKPGLSTVVTVATGSARASFQCRFDPARDRQSTDLPRLPDHPGLGR